MKRCLGTQNPLQNHWQNGLEHKGYHRMRVMNRSTDSVGWMVILFNDQTSSLDSSSSSWFFSARARERERESGLFCFFISLLPNRFLFPNWLCLFCVIFEVSSYLTPCIYEEPGANFIVPSVGHPKSVVFRIRESPPKMPKTLSEVF